jgi:hypothetical protein
LANQSPFAGIGPGTSPITSVGCRQIPSPEQWRTAKIRANGMVRFFGEGSPWYAFEVLRENILRVRFRGRSTRGAELRAQKWLISDLKERGWTTVSKTTRRKAAIDKFGISARGFERAWRQALAETGLSKEASRAGRKSAR